MWSAGADPGAHPAGPLAAFRDPKLVRQNGKHLFASARAHHRQWPDRGATENLGAAQALPLDDRHAHQTFDASTIHADHQFQPHLTKRRPGFLSKSIQPMMVLATLQPARTLDLASDWPTSAGMSGVTDHEFADSTQMRHVASPSRCPQADSRAHHGHD